MTTQAVEDYIKAIYTLGGQAQAVSTKAIAAHLSIQPASVTGMIKKLAQQDYVHYQPYQGASLTVKGKQLALGVIRHHRLLELFLHQTLNIPWDAVHQEAEKLEHVISRDTIARIDAFLGFPTFDPHGDPIPSQQGTLPKQTLCALTKAPLNEMLAVARVSDHDSQLLRYLDGLGIYLHATLTVVSVAPYGGHFTLLLGKKQIVLGADAAQYIFVAPKTAAHGKRNQTTTHILKKKKASKTDHE